jgi:hypothetical protein
MPGGLLQMVTPGFQNISRSSSPSIYLEEKIKNITFHNNCCVCMEDSNVLTECGHELCKNLYKQN